MVDLIKELESNRENIEKGISKCEGKLEDLKTEIIEGEETLTILKDGIKKEIGGPVQLVGAGYFTVGKNLSTGRYKAFPVSGNDNFVVYTSGGRLYEYNTILWSNGEMVFRLRPVMIIE